MYLTLRLNCTFCKVKTFLQKTLTNLLIRMMLLKTFLKNHKVLAIK